MVSRLSDWMSRRWPALVSAILLLLAFPPFDLWPLAFVALVPLFYYLRDVSRKEAWRVGYFFGLIYFFGQAMWLYSLAVHWTHSPGLAIIPWLLGSSYVALYFGWISILIRACYIRKMTWLIPIAWAGVEVFRSYIPVLAFPWGLMATPLYKSPFLIQTAHFGTIYLVSAWVVLLNLALTQLLIPKLREKSRPLIVTYLVLLGISGFQYMVKVPSHKFPITVGQPGVDLAFGDEKTSHIEVARNVMGFLASAAYDGSKLLVLPEGTVGGNDDPPQPDFPLNPKMPVLFGAQRGQKPTYQTAFGYDGKWHFADKTRLVIFGEFVPGRSTFPFLAKAFDLPTKDLDASQLGIQSVDVGGIRVGPMLCFEGLFPEVSYQHARNGSRLIAVMCIDDWYMGTAAPDQLRAAATFRAIESGLPLVRSASMGYSLVLDEHGNVLGELPLKKTAALRRDIEIPNESTLFPLIPVFPAAAFVTCLVLPWIKRGKSEKSD